MACIGCFDPRSSMNDYAILNANRDWYEPVRVAPPVPPDVYLVPPSRPIPTTLGDGAATVGGGGVVLALLVAAGLWALCRPEGSPLIPFTDIGR